jgi:tetrahydromethanopterin S-methyltransferase subunit G
MTVSDFDRFNGKLARKPRPVGANDYAPLEQLVKPPKSVDEPSSARFMELTTRITNVTIEARDALATPTCPSNFMGIPTKSMKCKPLRPGASRLSVDIKKGSVTLDKELVKTKDALNDMDLGRLDPGIDESATTYFQPGDVERAIGVFFGIMGGLVVCALVAYLVQRFVFSGYVSVIERKEAVGLKLPSIKMPKVSLPDIPKMLCPKD